MGYGVAVRPDLFDLLPDVVLFVAVARAKNFSRAARGLGMPVSTVSRRIADFEAKLGVQLLLRSTRQVELTDTGERYFARCQVLIETAEAAHAELHSATEPPRGKLRVSTTQDFALTYLTEPLADFLLRHPHISIELDLTPRSVDLIGDGVDVAIRMGALPDSQLYARRLGSAPQGLYAAPAYLARAGVPQAPGDLAGHECLRIRGAVDGETRWSLSQGEQHEVVSMRGRVVANGMRFLRELTLLGLGIAALDEVIARAAVAAGSLVRVLPLWGLPPVPVHALTPSKVLPVRTRVLLEHLGDHLPLTQPHPRRSAAG